MSAIKAFQDPLRKWVSRAIIILGGWHLYKKLRDAGLHFFTARQKQKLLEYFADESRKRPDIVILHQFPPSTLIPNPSPFALKLESFLRLANIQYEVDTTAPKGDKDKSPWITLNGRHYTDSQLIVEMLEKKLDKKLGNYSPEEFAIGSMARVMVEEHLFWGLILWRYVYSFNNGDDSQTLSQLFPYKSSKELVEFRFMAKKKYEQFAWGQGLGRHTKEEVLKLMTSDLKSLSLTLGDKPFFLGDQPTADDCAIFGLLAQFIWADLTLPFNRLINEELVNLKEYAIRMKETIWPDWEAKATPTKCTLD